MNREELLKDYEEAKTLGDDDLVLGILEKLDAIGKEKSWTDVGGQALQNLPKDIGVIGEGTINAVMNPIDTASGLASVIRGGMQHALPESVTNYLVEKGITPEARQAASAFIKPFKQDFGSVSGFKDALSERPAQTIMNLSVPASLARQLIKPLQAASIQKSIVEADKINALNAPKQAVLKAGQEAGYVIPPSEVNPSFINKRLESMAGKAAIKQQAEAANQPVTTALARKALNMPDDAPISEISLAKLRKEAAQPYRDVAALPIPPALAQGYSGPRAITTPAQDLEALKQARFDAKQWYNAAKMGNPEALAKAKELDRTARSLDAKIANAARAAGRNDLRQQLHEGRKKIAQSYDVEKALNVATGEIDPRIIGSLLDKGRPLTEELKTIGQFQQAFPKFMREGEKIPIAGVSKSEALAGLLLGTGGTAAFGIPGALLGAAPLMSTPIRNILLSKPYQKRMVNIPKAKAKSADMGKMTKAGIVEAIINNLQQTGTE